MPPSRCSQGLPPLRDCEMVYANFTKLLYACLSLRYDLAPIFLPEIEGGLSPWTRQHDEFTLWRIQLRLCHNRFIRAEQRLEMFADRERIREGFHDDVMLCRCILREMAEKKYLTRVQRLKIAASASKSLVFKGDETAAVADQPQRRQICREVPPASHLTEKDFGPVGSRTRGRKRKLAEEEKPGRLVEYQGSKRPRKMIMEVVIPVYAPASKGQKRAMGHA
ncbi:hypothetical protein FRC06_010298 [Ceratobasidium sp. 370]|nr:hypothetical protein FRC06_010298 [Ceratobasidium sp. 370]